MLPEICLALAIFHEARSMESDTWQLVSDSVKTRAATSNICKVYFSPAFSTRNKLYINSKEKILFEKIKIYAKKILNYPVNQNRIYFNNCYLGVRFKTKFKPIVKKQNKSCLIFY